MNVLVAVFDVVERFLRPGLFGFAVVLGAVALVDWMVRTRRVNAFSPIARFSREKISPLFRPMEQRIVRAGGNPQTAPWWTLVAAVVGGIVLLSLLGFVRDQLVMGMAAAQGGAAGIVFILARWTFMVLRLALMVRVISSWVQVSPYSKWVRWAVVLSEPILAPLRRVIPPLGMMDISPIVAFFGLSLLESLVLGALR